MLRTTSPYLALKGQVTNISALASIQGAPRVTFTFTPDGQNPVQAIAYGSDATNVISKLADGTKIRAKGLMFEDPEAMSPEPKSGFILTAFEHLGSTEMSAANPALARIPVR